MQDKEYEEAGARIVSTGDALAADIVLKIRPPDAETEVPQMRRGGVLVSYIQPAVNKEVVKALEEQGMTVIGAPLAVPLARNDSLANHWRSGQCRGYCFCNSAQGVLQFDGSQPASANRLAQRFGR